MYQTQGNKFFKILTRCLTPSSLYKMYLHSTDLCWRCGVACPRHPTFLATRSIISGLRSDESLKNLLIIIYPSILPGFAYFIIPYLGRFISVLYYLPCSVRQKAIFPIFWKQTRPPSIATWLTKVEKRKRMLALPSTSLDSRDKFLKKWFYWHEFYIRSWIQIHPGKIRSSIVAPRGITVSWV